MEINKSQLEQFVRNLQQSENQYFNSSNSNKSSSKITNPKLTRLNEKKIKMVNKLKYQVMEFIRLLDEIDEETKTPSKIKAVGI